MLKLDISANEPNPLAVMKKFLEESGKITKIENLRDKQNLYYSLFVNAIAIFPLLGMLGTVISLLQLASGGDNLIGNFYGALTSTLWGLVFAVIFKAVDAFISAKVDANEKAVSFRLQKFLESEQEREQRERSRIRKKSGNSGNFEIPEKNPEKNKELQEVGI